MTSPWGCSMHGATPRVCVVLIRYRLVHEMHYLKGDSLLLKMELEQESLSVFGFNLSPVVI